MSGGEQSSEFKSMLTKNNSANQPQGCTTKNQNELNHHQQQQQEALANLFRSLSNLAHGSAQIPSNQLLNMDNCPPVGLMNLTIKNLQAHDSASSSSAQSPSLHGVVAAAMMQQQFVTAATSQERTMSTLESRTTSTNTNICEQSSQLLANKQMPFSSGHLTASYPLVSHAATPISLEHEVQYSIEDYSGQSQQQQQQHQHHQQPQRINYCTICNKELCNKYFMKTHMLKMHGINLEMDQSGSEEEAGQSHLSDNTKQDSDEHHVFPADSNNPTLTQARKSVPINRQPPGGQQPNKSKSSATTASSSSAKSATSVMNGFAGNSMGGVVCDICNKELCSKYFLKVHKQNTHGIMTDYQDANQFVYPFPNTLANPFMPPQIPISMPTNNMFPSNACFNQDSSLAVDGSQSEFRLKSSCTKRARTTANNKQLRGRTQPGIDQHIDSIYRLMMNQLPQPGAARGQPPFAIPAFDSGSSNPMNALMCLGAMNPFGPSSISPTMVVDLILRNQHLINRNKSINQQCVTPSQCPAGKSGKDKNNNDSKQAKPTTGKAAKECATSSRYFTHYTEACPMCDRRFKSIKWLKTHMMNDHKQEIGTYMQMIMQNMCANKSQPTVQLVAQPYDQTSNYSSINFGHHNASAIPPLQQQQTIPYNTFQPQATGILQTEQYNIVQNYLNQQRQMLQQQQQLNTQEMIDTKPEPSYSEQKMNILSLAEAHHQSRETSSSSSASKTSPRSLMTGLDCDDDNQQLDLTMKFNLDTRPQSRKRSLELNEDDYLNDDETSTRSSYDHREEQQKSPADAIETNDLSRVQVKTSLDA